MDPATLHATYSRIAITTGSVGFATPSGPVILNATAGIQITKAVNNAEFNGGNMPLAEFKGAPPEVLAKLGIV